MNFSRDEWVFICGALHMMEHSPAKASDKREAQLLIDKIQKHIKAHENVWRPDYEQIRNRMGGFQLEPTIRM